MTINLSETKKLLNLVARRVIDNTSYKLRNVKTNETYAESSTLTPSADIIVHSHHNGWFYQNLLVLNGMKLLGAVTGDALFSAYPDRNLDFIVEHLPFFIKQHELSLLPETQGESELSRIGYYFKWSELWMTGLTPFWFDKAIETQGEVYQDYIRRYATFVKDCTKIDGDLLANIQLQIRTDDAYLMLPGIARLAKLEKNPERYDEAIFQMLGFHRRLFDRKDFLYRHIWDITTGQYAPAYWGRGNGWMALAHVDLLETIPKSHRQYSELIRMYREQMSGLLKWESKEGGWTQVIEESSSWVESSCTGMMIWALAKGLKSGWLEDSPAYQGLCERAWDRLCQNVKDDGVVIDTCPSTGPGNKQHYLDRPRLIDDTHSMGPFLMAGAAMLDWQK